MSAAIGLLPTYTVTKSARARSLAIIALALGMLSFAGVAEYRWKHHDEDKDLCKPFTIGQSTIGGCDWIE